MSCRKAARLLLVGAVLVSATAVAQENRSADLNGQCGTLPSHDEITSALRDIVEFGNRRANGGLGNHVWAVLVNRQGAICVVARSGRTFGQQWPASRAIAASKAYTANAFSLANFSLSTSNLYYPVQPGNSLYGAGTSNPIDAPAVYEGAGPSWGTPDDPLNGRRIGGTTAFGGGLSLYSPEGKLLGALGVSGDESCTDHVIAWKTRHRLNLDNVPAGVADGGTDNIIYDLVVEPGTGRLKSASGYGHPTCSGTAAAIAEGFRETAPVGPEE